jgi:hypothetical protein
MKKILSMMTAAALLCSWSFNAAAAPGWAASGLTVAPQDAAKVVEAFDALFASKVGRKLPGRVILRVNLADGNNPETHSVVSLFNSAAEFESYGAELRADPAWGEFMAKMSGLTQGPGTTMRGMIAYNSGERADSDVVWVNHYVTVSEPAVLLSAMRNYSQSATGQASPAQVHLSAVTAGGVGSASHIISVGWASEAEWEGEFGRLAGNAQWNAYIRTMRAVSEYHGATLQRDIKSWGKTSVEEITALGN